MNTIDDLTQALSNFSQVTPDSLINLTCCCGLSDCENSQAWLERKSQLESRLTLSAGEQLGLDSQGHSSCRSVEVGQALLQRHEAYIRQHEVSITGLLVLRMSETLIVRRRKSGATKFTTYGNRVVRLILKTTRMRR
jgi:hypothetical protein